MVAYREIRVAGASFTLEAAHRCKSVPQPTSGRDVVLDGDASRHRCRLRPWQGQVSLAVRDAEGRWQALPPAYSDREGHLRMRFAELERSVREATGRSLDAFVSLRIGRGGWAGTYDLVRLRALQADVHAEWIRRGRGVPGLFGVLHGAHPGADAMAELALEASLARQEEDFAAVVRGELSPAAFLDRHAWSPLRLRAAAMLSRAPTDTVTTP